jgi:hypothetical protein
MSTVPVIASDNRLYDRVKAIVDSRAPQAFGAVRLFATPESAGKFLGVQTPELMFINFSDTFRLFEDRPLDSRFRHSSVIALCEECATIDRINALRDVNILASLTFADIEKQLPGILDIIHTNRPLLYGSAQPGQDGILSGSFRLRNNLFEAACSLNLICNYCYLSNKLTLERKYFFHLPLYEMLINAIEHGNCGISYNEKSRFLERGGCAPDLIQKKCDEPAVASKMVSLSYELHPLYARFVITDQGRGFDWRTVMRALSEKDLLRLNGRGILIARETVRSLRFNEKGNEVTLEIGYGPSAETACGPAPVRLNDNATGQNTL